MVEIVRRWECAFPHPLEVVNEDAFWHFLEWEEDKKILHNRIIKKVEGSIYNIMQFSDENRPPEPAIEKIFVDGEAVEVAVAPTTKRPAYQKINEEFGAYLDVLVEEHGRGIRREGVITIKDEAYALVSMLQGVIEEKRKGCLEGREGITKKILIPERFMEEIPETLSILLEKDYGELCKDNIRVYYTAKSFITVCDEKRIRPWFKRILLEDSMNLLGERPKDPVAVDYPYGDIVFVHQLEPRNVPRPAVVISSFVKESPKKITKRSKIGDFVKISLLNTQYEEKLRNSGLLPQDFLADYKPVFRKGAVYASLGGIKRRLRQYRETCITESLEQNLFIRRKRV